MDDVKDFLAWYLAPWRKMHRGTFSMLTGIASIPGVFFMFGGGASGGSGLMGSLSSVFGQDAAANNMAQAAFHGDVKGADAVMQQMNAATQQLQDAVGNASAAATPVVHSIDWGVLVNDFCLILLVPAVLMRLRDMGYAGRLGWVFVALMYACVPMDVLGQVGMGEVPGLTLANIVNVLGFIWLCVAASDVTPREERGKPSFLKVDSPDDWNKPRY